MASAFANNALGAVDEAIYDPATDGGCSAFSIYNAEDASADALIHVEPMHKDGEYFPIQPGTEKLFRARWDNIKSIVAKGDGAIISGGIVEF